MADYQVQANLKLKVQGSKELDSVANKTKAIDKDLKKTSKSSADFTGVMVSGLGQANNSLLEFLKALPGLMVIARGIKSIFNSLAGFFSGGMKYASDLENLKISIAAQTANLRGISFKNAAVEADEIYNKIVKAAAAAPVGPRELAEIYQGLQGSMMQIGADSDRIVKMSKNASAALGVFNIKDIQAGARHLSLMAAGMASQGEQVIFTKLLKGGYFGENMTTEIFNKMEAAKRIKLIEKALEKAGGAAAEAFAKSWFGLASTFAGLAQEFRRVFIDPIKDQLASVLGSINDYLNKNKDSLDSVAKTIGLISNTILKPILDKGLAMFKAAGDSIKKFGEYTRLTSKGQNLFGSIAPAAGAAGTIGGFVGGGAITGAGIGAGLGGAWMGLGGAIIGSMIGPVGTALGGAIGTVVGNIVGGLYGMFAGGIIGSGLMAIFLAFKDILYSLYPILLLITNIFAPAAFEAFLAIWTLIKPLLVTIGRLVGVVLLTAFIAFITTLTVVAKIIEDIFASLAQMLGMSDDIIIAGDDIQYALNTVLKGFIWFANKILLVYSAFMYFAKNVMYDAIKFLGLGKHISMSKPGVFQPIEIEIGKLLERDRKKSEETKRGKSGQSKNKKMQPGAKIDNLNMYINQSFKDANPSRIVSSMFEDLEQQAERTLTSDFSGALSF